jgi:hypothetical protein
MSVNSSDILLKFSVSAAAGNTTAGTAATSLGDQVSTTQLTSASIGNLFDDVSASEASAGDTEYRCIFVHNNHATDTAFNVTVAVQSEVSGGASFAVALDNIGVVAVGSASAQAATVANENTAPSGVGAFGAGPLSIGTMGPGTVAAVWVRRTTSASTAALSTDGATIRIAGEG